MSVRLYFGNGALNISPAGRDSAGHPVRAQGV